MMNLTVTIASLMLLLAACGEDTESDDLPNILTGATGIIIAVIVVWLIVRAMRKRD